GLGPTSGGDGNFEPIAIGVDIGRLLKELLKKNDVKITDTELQEMLEEIDTSYIERQLKKQIDGKSEPIAKKMTEPLVRAGEKVGKTLMPKK
ncbi:MAG: hypothetical protein P8Y17_01270, partial [Patescibacteria group bacterium]